MTFLAVKLSKSNQCACMYPAGVLGRSNLAQLVVNCACTNEQPHSANVSGQGEIIYSYMHKFVLKSEVNRSFRLDFPRTIEAGRDNLFKISG